MTQIIIGSSPLTLSDLRAALDGPVSISLSDRAWAAVDAGAATVAANDDGSAELARGDHVVEHQSRAVAIAQADPADTGGQALKGDALARHIQPAVQADVIGE